MARVLFTSTQGIGHFRPLRPFIASARRAGHEVAVVTPPALADVASQEGVPVHLGADPPEAELASVWKRVREGTHAEAGRLVYGEIFGRLKTEGLLPRVRQVVADWRPDLVVHESAEFAGPIAAEEAGIPHAVVGVSQATTDMLEGVRGVLDGWVVGLAAQIRTSPYLTVFPASLDAAGYERVHRLRLPAEAARSLPDYWNGQGGPLVYVTFGTVTRDTAIGAAAYQAAIDAVRDLPARVLITTGGELPADVGPLSGPRLHTEHWIPQADVLPHVAVVLCHGGSGTMLGALANGVPLVVVPLFADQQANARSVVGVGAGVAVAVGDTPPAQRTLGEADVPRMRSAVETVLTNSSYRTNAARIADEMGSHGPIDSVWDLLLP